MRNTPETREALLRVIATADRLHTGYQITVRVCGGGNDISLNIRQPRDTDEAVYPEIYFSDDWYGEDAVSFEISTTGYSDHSLKQAHRVIAGLCAATKLVENLYTAFEVAGFNTRR